MSRAPTPSKMVTNLFHYTTDERDFKRRAHRDATSGEDVLEYADEGKLKIISVEE
jgi:hypothetical protein